MAELNPLEQPLDDTLLVPVETVAPKKTPSSAMRDALFTYAIKGDEEGVDKAGKILSLQQELEATGTSEEVENLKASLNDAFNKHRAEEANKIIFSDMDVKRKVDLLYEIKNKPAPQTVEQHYINTAQQVDNQYVSAIQAIQQKDWGKLSSFTFEETRSDPIFLKAARQVAKLRGDEDKVKTDEEAADYGIKVYRRMFNPEEMVEFALVDDEDDALALSYLYTKMEATENTLSGAGGAVWEMVTSPVNALMAVFSLGAGPLVKQMAAKGVVSAAVKSKIDDVLMQMATKKAIATEGALYGLGMSLSQQEVEKTAGLREEISAKEAAISTAVGGAVGFALPALLFPRQTAQEFKGLFKSPAQVAREASPQAGRAVSRTNIMGSNPGAGELPEKSLAEVGLPKGVDETISAGPSLESFHERVAREAPLLRLAMTDEQVSQVERTWRESLVKLATRAGAVVRQDKSVVTTEGDVLVANIAVGKSEDVGFTRLDEVADLITRFKEADKERFSEFEIISRQKDGSFEVMGTADAAAARKLESQSPEQASGEYFLRVKKQRILGDQPSDIPEFAKGEFQGLGGIFRLFGWSGQQSKEFAQAFIAGANQQARFRLEFEQPLVPFRNLSMTDQLDVVNAWNKVHNNRWMTRQEAIAELGADKAEAYLGGKAIADNLFEVFDRVKTDEARKKGFRQLSIESQNQRIFLGAGKEVSIDEIGNASRLVDGANGIVDFDDAMRAAVRTGERKVFRLLTPVKAGKETSDLVISDVGAKVEMSYLGSILKKREDYIPGIRRASYVVFEKASGYRHNGVEIAADQMIQTQAGQRALTVGFAGTEADALRVIKELKQTDPSRELDFKLSRELSDSDFSALEGFQSIDSGLIYGSKSSVDLIEFKGAGELKDIVQSFENLTDRAASILTYERVLNFKKQQWVNTYAPGKVFPRDRAEAKAVLGGEARGTPEFQKKLKTALKAWDAIDTQEMFNRTALAKKTQLMAQRAADVMSKIPGAGPVARWLARMSAEGISPTQWFRTGAFYSQVALSFSQIGLNAANIGLTSAYAAAMGPKIFAQASRDLVSLLVKGDKVLVDQWERSGLKAAIEQHDLAARVVAMKGRELQENASALKNFGRASAAIASSATRQTFNAVKKATFIVPETANKANAFIVARRIYMDRNNIKDAAQITNKQLLEIVSEADTLVGVMNNAGRFRAGSAPVLDVITQYISIPYKYSTLLASGLPFINKTGYTQKVIDPKAARRLLIASVAAYGYSGIGFNETWNQIREMHGISPDGELDQWLRNGVFGMVVNSVAETFNGDETVDSEIAISQRFSPFNSSGTDFFLRPATALIDAAVYNQDPREMLMNFPASSFGGSLVNYAQVMWDFYSDMPDGLDNEDAAWYTFYETLRLTSAGKQTSNAYLAYNLGKLYDRRGVATLGGVSKTQAMALLMGARPQAEQELRRIESELIKGRKKLSDNEINEKAKELYDRKLAVINAMANFGIADLDKTRQLLRAEQMLVNLSGEPNEVARIYQRFYQLAISEKNQDRKDKLFENLSQLVTRSEYSEDTKNLIKSAPDSIIPADKKELLLREIDRANENYKATLISRGREE